MNRTLLSLMLATALAAGCRDLHYPEGDEAVNAPPDVAFVLPLETDIVSSAPVISIDARDPNGISSVTLLCAGAPVFVWTSPPFSANVDLGGCGGTTSAEGRRTVTLSAVARDVPGLESPPVTRNITIDASVAQLYVSGPGRAAPHGSYVARITADRPLGAVPVARIGSLAAAVVPVEGTPPLTTFDATFTELPGLPAERFDAGTAPLEVLEDLEETLLLEVEGRATSGNTTRAVARVAVSQIAWEVPVPIFYRAAPSFTRDDALPVALAEGLVLMFQARSGATPGTLAHEDGRYLPFPAEEGERLSSDGYFLEMLDARGRAWFRRGVDPGGYEYAVHDPLSGEEVGTFIHDTPLAERRRMGEGICYEELFNPGACDNSGTRSLVCLTPEGVTRSTTISDQGLAYDTSLRWAISDGVYLGYQNFTTCTFDGTAVFRATPGGASRIGQLSAGGPGPDRILPLSGGRFLVSQYSAAAGYRLYVIDENLAEQGDFFPTEALARFGLDPSLGSIPADYLLTTRPSDELLFTLRHTPQHTVIEAWQFQAPTPAATLRIPGKYFIGVNPARAAIHGSDGTLFLTLEMGSLMPGYPKAEEKLVPGTNSIPGRGIVLAVDPELRLRWLYRTPSNAPGEIFAHPSEGHLYFVDEAAGLVTAFHR